LSNNRVVAVRGATALVRVQSAEAARELKNISTMSRNSNHGLGPLLRAHRERQGLTLEALAESIKVKRSLLDDLEQNDVSRWPPGIFGRALVREYAKSIGLPTDDIVRQFLELLSPEERCDAALAPSDAAVDHATAEFRLTLANIPDQTSRQIAQRLVGAAAELVFVLVTGGLVALATGLPIWTSNAIVALIWVPAAALLCGHEALYRIVRLDRWKVFSTHPRAARISAATASLASIGNTIASASSGAPAEALFVEPETHVDPSGAASVH
jgi:transcriptional regulator with XRE-family HTH domain